MQHCNILWILKKYLVWISEYIFLFHFSFLISQISKINCYIITLCNNINLKINDLKYYYSKYFYFSHFTISSTLFSYFTFFIYIFFLYFNKIFISKNKIYFQNPIPGENKNIYFYLSVWKIHFPRSWWKDCRKSETAQQHTMILRARTSSIPFNITGTGSRKDLP